MTPTDGPLPESSHLRQDINIPEEATIDEPGESPAGDASLLNAGQQTAGMSPLDARGGPGSDPAQPDAEES
jgi:hypothetical protein